MIDFTVNVRPDTDNRGANTIELILPEGELMLITTRGEGFHPDADDGSDGDTHDQDKALYYAVERIAQLEADLEHYKKYNEQLGKTLIGYQEELYDKNTQITRLEGENVELIKRFTEAS